MWGTTTDSCLTLGSVWAWSAWTSKSVKGTSSCRKGTYEETPWYLVFGWDIRPSERGDWWVLRTNLRIPPQLELDHDDHTWSLQHLEFNFIQLVVYPQRWKRAMDLAKAG